MYVSLVWGEIKFLERIKLEIDVAKCECGDSWKDSDLADLVNERLQALKNN